MKTLELALLVYTFSFPQFVGAQVATDLNCTQCVASSDIANDSVGSAKIKNKSITSSDIEQRAGLRAKLAVGRQEGGQGDCT